MTKVKYKYNANKQLGKYFNSNEFRCKCGKKHDLYIDSELVPFLENLMSKIGSNYAYIYSGYRCPQHEKEVGGNGGKDYSHSGYAVDIDFYTEKKGRRFTSKEIALACEDLGWNYGVGYRCGGNTKRTHIDSKHRKWYGDEKKSMVASIGNSFYTYFNLPKPTCDTYRLLKDKWFRKDHKVANNKIKKLKKGTIIQSLDNQIYTDNKGNQWIKTIINNQVGYVCINDSTGVQAKKC